MHVRAQFPGCKNNHCRVSDNAHGIGIMEAIACSASRGRGSMAAGSIPAAAQHSSFIAILDYGRHSIG